MDEDVENSDVCSEYGSMNINTDLQHNGMESLINDNDKIDTDITRRQRIEM